MKIIRAKDYKDMSRKAANIISAQVIMKPNCVLGLATGGTTVGAYAQLVEWYNKGDLDFSEVTTVNLDEYRGLPKEHPESYWSFMHKNLFDHVNIRPEAIHLPDGTNPDAADACAKYNDIIHSVGGIDLQLLGLGPNGHIGFNEPGEAFELETHCVDLTPATIEANTYNITKADTEHGSFDVAEEAKTDEDVAIIVAFPCTTGDGGDRIALHHTVTNVTGVPSVGIVEFGEVFRKFHHF